MRELISFEKSISLVFPSLGGSNWALKKQVNFSIYYKLNKKIHFILQRFRLKEDWANYFSCSIKFLWETNTIVNSLNITYKCECFSSGFSVCKSCVKPSLKRKLIKFFHLVENNKLDYLRRVSTQWHNFYNLKKNCEIYVSWESGKL